MVELRRTDSSNADFQALVALLDQDLQQRYGAEQAFFAQFNGLQHIKNVIVAYLDNQPVGCGAFKAYADNAVEIKRMFVRPDLRGQRIAQQVLSALESWAAELDAQTCVLETGKLQPEAIRLYERCGYELIPNYGQYAGVESSVCMQKRLGPARDEQVNQSRGDSA